MARRQDASPLVLVIDDVPPILRILELELKLHGFRVVGIEIAEHVYEVIDQLAPDVIVFEVFLPQIPGMELLKGIRQRWDTPVIFLTTSTNAADKEEALNLGASDYILKPFDPEDLTYRISALLKAPPPEPRVQTARDVAIDFSRRVATVSDRKAELTTTEWALLFSLGRRPRADVPAQDILLEVWGLEGALNRGNLAETIDAIRRKLGDDSRTPWLILGDVDRGYRLETEDKGGDF